MTLRDNNGAALIPDGARRLASAILCADFGNGVRGPDVECSVDCKKNPDSDVAVELHPQPPHGPQAYSDLVPSSWSEP
jgi:hypothetical protein